MYRDNINSLLPSPLDRSYVPAELIDLVLDIAIDVIGFEIREDFGHQSTGNL